MRLLLIFVVVALWLAIVLAGAARAEPCTRAHALSQGQPAPCAGDLLPATVTARLLDAQTGLGLAKTQLAECQSARTAEGLDCADKLHVERHARRLCEESRTPPPCPPRPAPPGWWERPYFTIPATMFATLGVVALVLTVGDK